MPCTVARLYRYPVKALNGEPMTAVDLQLGHGIAFDRAFGLALPTTQYEPARPHWLAKNNFVTLVQHERLAALEARFDAATGSLAVHRAGKQVVRGTLRTPLGRAMIEEFFRAYLKHEVAGPMRLIGAADAANSPAFRDSEQAELSLIGLATIADLERVVGQPVDPLRFRANIYVDGIPAWSEFDWIGRDVVFGGAGVEAEGAPAPAGQGEARIRVTERITRCAATNVEPGTGMRDMTLPQTLKRVFGHADCGVYATVTAGGTVALGDAVSPSNT